VPAIRNSIENATAKAVATTLADRERRVSSKIGRDKRMVVGSIVADFLSRSG
jgi:hypothetical protein